MCQPRARRKFVEALNLVPKVARPDSVAHRILELYQQVYEVERLAKGRSPRVIKKRRRLLRHLT